MLAERLTYGSAQMQVGVEDWPNGDPGIRLSIDDQFYLFTIDGAVRLRDALDNQIELVNELDEAGLVAEPTD